MMVSQYDCFPSPPSPGFAMPVCQLCGCVLDSQYQSMTRHVEFHNTIEEGRSHSHG